ncbi:MAG: hypothetical protein ACK4RK_04705 [Gemmataceae bacterium]
MGRGRWLAAGLIWGICWAGATAQEPPRVSIDVVRTGLPAPSQRSDVDNFSSTENDSLFKAGFWTPVYVDLTVGPKGFAVGEAQLVTETTDSDGIFTRYTIPIPPAAPKETLLLTTYTKPGNTYETIQVSVRGEGRNLCPPFQVHPSGHDPSATLLLSLGAQIPSLITAPLAEDGAPDPIDGRVEEPPFQNFADRRPRKRNHVGVIDAVVSMPEHWFGYEAVDLLVFATGNRDFLTALLDDKDERIQRKRRAVVEWVRRGGRIVIAAGRNQDLVGQLPDLADLLPVSLKGVSPLSVVHPRWVTGGQHLEELIQPRAAHQPPNERPTVEITQMVPKSGQDVVTLLQTSGGPPLIMQAAQGLGIVTVIAFDLDQQPFLSWRSQREFWQELLPLSGVMPTSENSYSSRSLVSQMQHNLEDFQEVPVIPFGWVALFIFLYILVVGPLDYFILKKVVHRLELTWVTFPSIVLLISGLAYFVSYAIKGNDLRVNKVDVIDIDLTKNQLYGHTWFTLFSPRIEYYTIGVEPTAPRGSAPAEVQPAASGMTVSWFGSVTSDTFGGGAQTGGQSLFRRSYDYAPNAIGLEQVPIPVWSTKSFTASWHVALDPNQLLLESDLTAMDWGLEGTVTSKLPVILDDAVLLHWNANTANLRVYRLDRLLPEQTQTLGQGHTASLLSGWIQEDPSSTTRRHGVFDYRRNLGLRGTVKHLLFFSGLDGANAWSNDGPRPLDLTWRLRHDPRQAILFGRVAAVSGPAEEVSQNPASTSRLWLGALPTAGATRPPLPGKLQQETYLRVIVPLQAPTR